jgi:hypothetical protein
MKAKVELTFSLRLFRFTSLHFASLRFTSLHFASLRFIFVTLQLFAVLLQYYKYTGTKSPFQLPSETIFTLISLGSLRNRKHAAQPALQRHNTKISKQIFPEKELRDHSPNSYILVSGSDLHIPTIGLPILLNPFISIKKKRRDMFSAVYPDLQ